MCLASTATFLFTGCGDPAGTGGDAVFSNISDVDPYYVAYLSPDPIYKKDTVSVSFDYRNVASVEVSATLDSGKVWFSVPSPAAEGNGSATITWVPMDDAAHFSYFGRKQCLIKIADPAGGVEAFTDSFFVVGSVPFELTSPEGNEEYKITDTIHVYYAQNQDLTARVSALVFPDADDDSTSVSLRPGNELPGTWEFITYFHTALSLDNPDYDYDRTGMPKIIIMVADYGTQVIQKSTDPITIVP